MNTPRPTTVTIASVLLLLVSLFDLPTLFTNGPTPPLSYIILGLGVCGLPAVLGLWKLKPWGMWLSIMLAVLGLLPAILGLIGAPLVGKVVSVLVFVVYALVLVLVMLPTTRKAFASSRARVAA